MKYSVFLHPDVVKYLDLLTEDERKRCYEGLKNLSNNPYRSRSGCDIKKMSGKKEFYRLRVGKHRFLYVIKENDVLVEEGFKREKGY
ncbi:MAG TPA: type II toxin-antitoxin system RelE/ParE family toxin [Methanomicrobia archaeon]|nr:type II toxin-antitoxin system RelE/ParE family toxin [Methanomicrobia archaeon]